MPEKKKKLMEFVKGCSDEDLLKFAKAQGYEDSEEDKDEKEEKAEEEDMDKSLSAGQLQKSMERVEAGLARTRPALAAPGLGEAATIDGTGLVKSLIQGTNDAFSTLGAALDDMSAQLESVANVGLASGHVAMRLQKSLATVQAGYDEIKAGHAALIKSQGEIADRLDSLLKAVNAPERPRSIASAPAPRFQGETKAKDPDDESTGLTKSQAVARLLEVQRRCVQRGDMDRANEIVNDITFIEAGGHLTRKRLEAIEGSR